LIDCYGALLIARLLLLLLNQNHYLLIYCVAVVQSRAAQTALLCLFGGMSMSVVYFDRETGW